jgi:uncharacterized repeat protein (TIGR01451 family)
MKKRYVTLLFVLLSILVQAQVINFPNQNFKNRLLATSPDVNFAKNLAGAYFKIDANNNGQIEVAEAAQVSWLYARQCNTNSLVGIEYFVNLKTLHADENFLTSLDVSACTQLEFLYCDGNYLNSLNVSGCPNLKWLFCGSNNLTSLNIDNNTSLTSLDFSENMISTINTPVLTELLTLQCSYTQLEYLDLMNCTKLASAWYDNNPQLTTLLIKNGVTNTPSVYNCTSLLYVCCDESELNAFITNFSQWNYTNCSFNSYCSFVPGGSFYTFQSNTSLDLNTNGCDSFDPKYPFLKYTIASENYNGIYISDSSGESIIAVTEGDYTFTPFIENPSYFTLSSSTIPVSFPDDPSPFLHSFCITPNGNRHDLEVTIIPTSVVRPGFDATFKIIFKNNGNQSQSGSLQFNFDDSKIDYVSSSIPLSNQSQDFLYWDYANLLPFESREISLTLNVNSPMETPSVNGGDDLGFSSIIYPVDIDENYVDNHSQIKLVVVNSYDPNDKTCLEGQTITPTMVGNYVHYVIRFENTGTFPAENVVVTDNIDTTKFDLNTLVPQSSSHSFVTRIINGKVEFIFENINLPFEDATNDGYVAFKIKTNPNLVIDDTFTNEANIFFDYNYPITTNLTSTTVTLLNSQDFAFDRYFTIYPNPAQDVLHVKMNEVMELNSVSIYNTLGQIVLAYPGVRELSLLDVSRLKRGAYFIKLTTEKGSAIKQFIKD